MLAVDRASLHLVGEGWGAEGGNYQLNLMLLAGKRNNEKQRLFCRGCSYQHPRRGFEQGNARKGAVRTGLIRESMDFTHSVGNLNNGGRQISVDLRGPSSNFF